MTTEPGPDEYGCDGHDGRLEYHGRVAPNDHKKFVVGGHEIPYVRVFLCHRTIFGFLNHTVFYYFVNKKYESESSWILEVLSYLKSLYRGLTSLFFTRQE